LPVGDAGSAVTSLPITPAFVLPYKRYACQTLLHLVGIYVENDQQSYRQTASPGKRVIGYQPPEPSAIEERALHHSTIWCMLTWLGSLGTALAQGRQQIQEHHPGSTCHRFVGAVAPPKYRSPTREELLRRSRQLLHLIAEWEALFPQKFFPRFATRAGFL